MLKNYKELNVWQKSYELCLTIYQITAKFPNEERYGLASRINKKARRSAVSIPSNIAEGYGTKTTLDYMRMREPLTPGIPGPSSLTHLEKNHYI